MPVKLYILYASPPARATMMVASAIELDVELQNVDFMGGGHLKPEYIKMNPQHTIPTLDDNGFCIWDSHAIATYLISKYAKDDSLYPKDLQKRAVIDQRLHFDTGILFPRIRNTIGPVIYKGETSINPENYELIEEAYDFSEKFLSLSSWIAGEQFTVADICCVASISTLNVLLKINESKYPHLAKWLKRCETLDIYKKWNARGVGEFDQLIKSKLQ